MSTRVPTSSCPNCGYQMASATGIDAPAAAPSPNDVSLCLDCGAVNIFNDELRLTRPTPRRMKEIMASDAGHQIRAAQIMIAGRGELNRRSTR